MIARLLAPALLAALCGFAPRPNASAQAGLPQPELSPSGYAVSGTIADAEGTPIDAVEISIVQHDSTIRRVRGGADGRFRIDGLPFPRFDLEARRMGFLPHTTRVNIDNGQHSTTVFIKLDAVADKLGTVYVDDGAPDTRDPNLREFYSREQANKLGYFIDENTMRALRPEFASEALRRIPGVVVRPSRRFGNDVRIRGCAPLVWIDGVRSSGAQIDDVVSGASVAAMEIYSSLAGVPPQYMDRSATCGTILVWLKSR
jgi:carboxypeptidase family protein/TonB-dependent receptor-like protein